MSRSKHQSYPKKEEKEEHETVRTLKAANRRLKSENEKLLSQIATLEKAFAKTSKYLKDNTDNISVEKIIQGVKEDKKLVEIKKLGLCSKCGSGDLKELPAGRAGYIKICVACNDRSMVRYNNEEK